MILKSMNTRVCTLLCMCGQRKLAVGDEPVDLIAEAALERDLWREAQRLVQFGGVATAARRADDEVVADGGPNRIEDAMGEAQPIVETAAVVVGPGVGGRRPKAVVQMAVGHDLDAALCPFDRKA